MVRRGVLATTAVDGTGPHRVRCRIAQWEYPVARAYVDARVQRIYGGTNEIAREIIARTL